MRKGSKAASLRPCDVHLCNSDTPDTTRNSTSARRSARPRLCLNGLLYGSGVVSPFGWASQADDGLDDLDPSVSAAHEDEKDDIWTWEKLAEVPQLTEAFEDFARKALCQESVVFLREVARYSSTRNNIHVQYYKRAILRIEFPCPVCGCTYSL